MTDRIPLIVNTGAAQIQELANGDGLLLTNSNIVNAGAITANSVSVTGNVTGNYILGNGSFLTGVVSSYDNASVQAFLGSGSLSSNIVPAGNGVHNLGTPTARFGDIYLSGNTVFLGAAELSANATAVTITNPVGGTFTLEGNTASSHYGNANVAGFLPTYTGNVAANNASLTGGLTATGNIQVINGIFIGNGAGLTGVTASGNVGAASKLENGTTEFNIPVVNGNVVGNIGGVTNVFEFSTTGLSVAGNVAANYYSGNGRLLTGLYGNTEVGTFLPTYTGNLESLTGNVITTGNISANYILGNGSQLTGLPATYGNADVSDYLASGTNTANIITSANIAGGNLT